MNSSGELKQIQTVENTDDYSEELEGHYNKGPREREAGDQSVSVTRTTGNEVSRQKKAKVLKNSGITLEDMTRDQLIEKVRDFVKK